LTTANQQRDDHLRSGDFLDVTKHPEITFHSKEVRPRGDRYTMTGDLTIRGVSRPVELDVELLGAINDPFGNRRVGVAASGEIDRKDWGLTWNMAVEAGGLLVGDKVKLQLEAELVRSLALATAEANSEAATHEAA
jgi:polyisoprenoid-binding protein YceI